MVCMGTIAAKAHCIVQWICINYYRSALSLFCSNHVKIKLNHYNFFGLMTPK